MRRLQDVDTSAEPDVQRVEATKAGVVISTTVSAPVGDYELVSSTADLRAAVEREDLEDKFIRVSGTPFLEFPLLDVTGTNFTFDCRGSAIDYRTGALNRLGPTRRYAFYNCVLFTTFKLQPANDEQGNKFFFVNSHLVGPCQDDGASGFTGPNMPHYINETSGPTSAARVTFSQCTTRCLDTVELELLTDALGRDVPGVAAAPSPQSNSAWEIATAVSATVLAIVLVALAAWCWQRRRAHRKQPQHASYDIPPPPPLSHQQERSTSWAAAQGSKRPPYPRSHAQSLKKLSTTTSITSERIAPHSEVVLERP